ncbi:MAG: hypothetical protein K0Q73_5332 [Paenibacillus sp.]|nr:hypothetical protein [Paenibacillus sp.]
MLEKNTEDIHPNNVFIMELNGVKPHVFELNDKLVSIYIYESEKGRKVGKKDFVNKTATASVVEHIEHQVKNIIIFYVHERNRNSSIEIKIQNAINELEKL